MNSILECILHPFVKLCGDCCREEITQEVREALAGAVAYHKVTMKMLDLTDEIKKDVDDASTRMSAISPHSKKIVEFYSEVKTLAETLSFMEQGKLRKPLPEIKKFMEFRKFKGFELEDQYMAEKLQEMKLMKEYVKDLYQNLEDFKSIQIKFALVHYYILWENGIKLGVEPQPSHMMIIDDENIVAIKQYEGKDSSREAWQREKLDAKNVQELKAEFPEDQPRPKNNEILALEKAFKGEPLDPKAEQFLVGFVADIHEKITTFIQRLDNIEIIVDEAFEKLGRLHFSYELVKEVHLEKMEYIKETLTKMSKRWKNRKGEK